MRDEAVANRINPNVGQTEDREALNSAGNQGSLPGFGQVCQERFTGRVQNIQAERDETGSVRKAVNAVGHWIRRHGRDVTDRVYVRKRAGVKYPAIVREQATANSSEGFRSWKANLALQGYSARAHLPRG
jgi:hypothetical protein